MIIMGIDTETTGLEQEKGHRIIEIAMLSYDLESGKKVDQYIQRINPERAIDPGAQAVHGIAYTDLVGEPKWEDVGGEICRRLGTAGLLVAHNMGFDGPFIAAELLRIGLQPPDVHSFCTKENGRWACPDGKYPNLGELCFALGVTYDRAKAHGADYDTSVMMDCFFRAYERGFFQLPKALQTMNQFQNSYNTQGKAA